MSDLATLTIHELAPLVERREVSPVDVTREALERIQTLDARLHSFITVGADQALAAAQAAEAEIRGGTYRGPLHGIPLGIKDNIAVAGWPTTNGSALMTDHVTDYDATVVERLRGAGAVIVGKNNMHEWAMGSTSGGGPFGSVHNPWDLDRVPGGSSGGSAAAVSASLIYGSVGTDGMGSIRMPASYSGVVGLKPTYGLVSRFGELPPTSSNHDHLGPIVKDVTDAAIMLNALAGHDPRDPTSLSTARKDYTALLGRGITGIRVGVPQDYFFDEALPEVKTLVKRAIDQLASLGAAIHEVRLPSLACIGLARAASATESALYLLPFARQGPSAFADETIWQRVVAGQFVRRTHVMKAAQVLNSIRREFQAVMEAVDVLAVPTTLSPAFPIDQPSSESGEGTSSTATRLTFPFNFMGMPAISVPCGFTSNRLPVGLMVAGRHWEDDVVLQVAHAYEQAATGGYAVPPGAA